ncbi:MAG: hypothetical protein AABX47_10265 [Nanoarchaeota archaeon]
MKFQLAHTEAQPDANSDEIARTILARFGLLPRKKDGQAKMHSLLLEMYERKKTANREKKPEAAVMTVEDMGVFAGIARQTMYEYLNRWLDLNILKKTSFVVEGKVTIGYELNGPTIEAAFKKAQQTLSNHVETSLELVSRLQNEVKRDKLKAHAANQTGSFVKSESSTLPDTQNPGSGDQSGTQ